MWSDAVRNGLDAKNKLDFIEGKVKQPKRNGDEETIETVAWRQCNAMLRAWLRNVIDPKLHPSITFSQPIVDIWEELRGRYSAGNAPRVHHLKNELNECKQGGDSIVDYYTRLKTIWDELAKYIKIQDCTCGAPALIKQDREEEKVHQFLMSLDSRLYNNIRSNLLMKDPIAPLNRVYGLILREERHASITRVIEETIETAMAKRMYGTSKERGTYSKAVNDEDQPCTHCGKYYHTEENCYDKHGYEEVKARERGRGQSGGYTTRGSGGRGRGRGRFPRHYQVNAIKILRQPDSRTPQHSSTTLLPMQNSRNCGRCSTEVQMAMIV